MTEHYKTFADMKFPGGSNAVEEYQRIVRCGPESLQSWPKRVLPTISQAFSALSAQDTAKRWRIEYKFIRGGVILTFRCSASDGVEQEEIQREALALLHLRGILELIANVKKTSAGQNLAIYKKLLEEFFAAFVVPLIRWHEASRRAQVTARQPRPTRSDVFSSVHERKESLEMWRAEGMKRADAVKKCSNLYGVSTIQARLDASKIGWTGREKRTKA